ncbi:hypothetical protein GVAV_001110 [Gurleya vavrai]
MEDLPIGTKDYEIFLDKNITILLWDGRYFNGILRSFDQFNSITLEKCKETLYFDNLYSEIDRGTFVIRGENIIFLGIKENSNKKMKKINFEEIKKLISENIKN